VRVWPAPAKLNLLLFVVGRRPDGYHQLQTVFQFIDVCDELGFIPTDDGEITRVDGPPDLPEALDLSLRAARLLQRRAGTPRGVRVTLNKRIPTGGGLGGGSSDAATTLLALNELWGAGLSIPELAALGLMLGADVPVFVRGQAAWAEGIGEVLTPVTLAEPWYVVVVPPVQVSTAAVFTAFAEERRLTPYTSARTIRDLRDGYGQNDLEPLVRARYPEVEVAFRYLAAYGKPCMTGSGGCVFLELTDAELGRHIVAQLPAGFSGFVARGMNRHPLYRGDTT
jgi:4-diphosphocytidyl-2-C-methyl-D-erythritol kinase